MNELNGFLSDVKPEIEAAVCTVAAHLTLLILRLQVQQLPVLLQPSLRRQLFVADITGEDSGFQFTAALSVLPVTFQHFNLLLANLDIGDVKDAGQGRVIRVHFKPIIEETYSIPRFFH